ncbi:hypothetical protein D3C78_1339670 [compost metagenome]
MGALEGFVDVTPRRTDVVPRGKMLAGTAQDNHLDLVIVHRLAKRGIQRIGHLRVLRVVVGRPIQRQRGNVLGHAVEHRRLGLVDRKVVTNHELAVAVVHVGAPWVRRYGCRAGYP